VFDKKDSQGVCFIGHLDMKAFLKEYIQTSPGDVLDLSGNVIGKHEGAILYTIGERHGFSLDTKTTENEPHFVISKDIARNTITVTTKTENSNISTQRNSAKITETSFSQDISSYFGKEVCARIRYRQEKQSCIISKHTSNSTKSREESGEDFIVVFDTPQKGMAEGQSVVFYDGDTCIGGGILNFI
jgi:tRNA-specific 2-thiouridylase